jgi:hypothetical protein
MAAILRSRSSSMATVEHRCALRNQRQLEVQQLYKTDLEHRADAQLAVPTITTISACWRGLQSYMA